MDILSQREALIADLNDQLVSVEECLNQVEGAETLPYDMFREYQMHLVLLQNTHIPAELRSKIKLMERIFEVETLLNNGKLDIAQRDNQDA